MPHITNIISSHAYIIFTCVLIATCFFGCFIIIPVITYFMRPSKIGSSDINVKKFSFPTRIIPFKCLKFPYKCKLTTYSPALIPAAYPVAQAICRLNPPVTASRSSTSPAK